MNVERVFKVIWQKMTLPPLQWKMDWSSVHADWVNSA